MPVGRSIQTSLASGEFDPLLWSREDVSFFYNSARIIENAVPLPQGGAKRREGWRFRGLQRGPISSVDILVGHLSAPNGGTVANAIDGLPGTKFTTTTAIGTSTSYVVIRADFPSARRVTMWDFNGLHVTGLPSGVDSVVMSIQHSDGVGSFVEAAQIDVGDLAFNRRFTEPPDTDLGTDLSWRLVLLNPNGDDFGSAVVEFDDMSAWNEAGFSNGGTPGNFSLHRLTSSVNEEYEIVLTQGCADVYRSDTGAWVAGMKIPHRDDEVAQVKNAPNLDSMILYHVERPPQLLQHLGGDRNWHDGPVIFDSVVQFPFEDATTGGQNEIQFLRFESMTAGDKVLVEFNGERSSEIIWDASEATNATALEAAIEGLADISSVTVTVDNGTGVDADLLVEFDGDDGKQSWPILIIDILTGSGTVVLSRKQFGKPDADSLWSAARGFPRCGTFYQGRHWMGGFKSRPDLVIASRAGALFDFKEDTDPVVSSPIVVAPNIDDQITVQTIYPGRHLQIFTSSAELYVPTEPITIDNIALKVTSRHGATPNVQPVDVQGGTLFVDRNGRALREYLFTDTEQSYSAEPVSLLAGHLVSSPLSLVMRRARNVDEPTLLLLANTGLDRDGNEVPAAMVAIDRAQQVTGFCRVKTDGKPLEFSTSQSGDAFVMVERDLAGGSWNFFEQFDEDFMSDNSVEFTGIGQIIDVSEYPWWEGETVFVHGDGLPLGEFTVSGGQIDLGSVPNADTAHIGLKQVPRIILHPFKGKGETSPTMQNMRIFRVLLQMERTGAIAITAEDGGRPRKVALQNYDSGLMDPTLEEVLFSGPKRIGGLGKWQKEPTIELTQIEPMPFLIRSVTYDVRY